VKGGYTFVNDPSEVTVLQVVQLLDGEFESESGSGAGESRDVWDRAVAALRDVLSSTTIADVVQREAEAAGARMYYI
jgi:Rrf2 family transcriptional regulator, cysteine metabolism repressor